MLNQQVQHSKVLLFPSVLMLPVVILRALLQPWQYSSQQPLQAWFQGLSQW